MARRMISRGLIAALTLLAVFPALAASPPARASGLRSVTIGMGYVPNVQFAPFYVADQRGYYRQAGLDVHFNYGSSPNLLQLTAAGRDDFAVADGTDAITGVANDIHVTDIATLYQHLPVTIFSLARKGIRTIRDLRGRTVGIPGRFGSSYAAFLAALAQAHMRPSDLTIRSIGFTQAESVVHGSVDAAVGYSNNEPILLRRRGYQVRTIEIGTQTQLVGAGLIGGNDFITRNPALVRHFVQATLRGLAATVANPTMAFSASRRVHGLTTLRGRNVGDQYAVLLRSIAFWHDSQTRRHGLGYADLAQWSRSIRTLTAIGQLPRTPVAASVVTNRFVIGGPRA
jgi:NitT/TauT family transport system substrate-binding protein